MTAERISTIESRWASRGGGSGRTERRYCDLLIDGVPLSALIRRDVISPFGWAIPEEQSAAVDRLVGRSAPDLGERVSLYVCPECGDLGCGAVSVAIERTKGTVIWRDFGFQNNYEESISNDGLQDVGPFAFDKLEYEEFFEELRHSLMKHGF